IFKPLRQILGVIVVLFNPTLASTTILADLANLPISTVHVTVNALRSILDVPSPDDNISTIRLLHPSFREFITDKGRCDGRFWVDERLAHANLFYHCIEIMSKALKEDICGLRLLGTLATMVGEDVLKRALPAEVRYACRYWI